MSDHRLFFGLSEHADHANHTDHADYTVHADRTDHTDKNFLIFALHLSPFNTFQFHLHPTDFFFEKLDE